MSSAPLRTGSGVFAESRPNRCLDDARRTLAKLAYGSLLVAVALYFSVFLEETARGVSRSETTHVSKRAQALLNLIGRGQLGRSLLSAKSRRQRMREEFEDGVPSPTFTRALWSSFSKKTAGSTDEQPQVQMIDRGPPESDIDWRSIPIREKIPVVFLSGHVPNEPNHPAITVLKQARKLNEDVFLVGPNPNLKHLQALNITIEPLSDYNQTYNWVERHIGVTHIVPARFWYLKAFMLRHSFSRVLCLTPDVMLYANATEMVAWLYPDAKVVLPVRWPSMQPPLLPSQYPSTLVSSHTTLWHIDALSDFLELHETVLKIKLFGGTAGGYTLAAKKEYADSVVLGWYAYQQCWSEKDMQPPCIAEPITGIARRFSYRLRRTRYRTKFRVQSFCQPRKCQNSTWSDEGYCVLDNNFSVGTPSHFFKFGEKDKCPQSKMYEHFQAWMGQTARRKNIQFLSVSFQGSRRDYLKLEDLSPWKSWGSAVF